MSFALFLLTSGDAFAVGLGLVALAGLVGLAWPRLATPLGLVGLALAVASAVPLSVLVYALLAVVLVVWIASFSRARAIRRAVTALLLSTVVGVALLDSVLAPTAKWQLPPTSPLFVVGDSLSAGLAQDLEGTWPALLRQKTGRSVQNLARTGARLRDGIAQVKAIPPGESVVLIELGGNDILTGATPDDFAAALRALLAQSTAPGRSLLMFELPLLPLQNRFGRVQRQICAEYSVALIPRRVLAAAITLPGHATDGLHLSPEGHRWLAERVAAWL